jgi:hypothetical protein
MTTRYYWETVRHYCSNINQAVTREVKFAVPVGIEGVRKVAELNCDKKGSHAACNSCKPEHSIEWK